MVDLSTTYLGKTLRSALDIVGSVTDAVNLPVVVKLSPLFKNYAK